MSIQFRDFSPDVLEPGILWDTFEGMPALMNRINQWIASESIRVLNFESILFPGVDKIQGTSVPRFTSVGDIITWTQCVRVWYESPN